MLISGTDEAQHKPLRSVCRTDSPQRNQPFPSSLCPEPLSCSFCVNKQNPYLEQKVAKCCSTAHSGEHPAAIMHLGFMWVEAHRVSVGFIFSN